MLKKLAIAAATVLFVSTNAHALNDYTDPEYQCDDDEITEQMQAMYTNPLSPKVIYVTGATELSRKTSELSCRVTVALSTGNKQVGVFRYVNQDGHALVRFTPGIPRPLAANGARTCRKGKRT